MPVPALRRDDFPALDRFTYLNTASTGLVPVSAVRPAHDFEAELAQAGTTGMDEDTEVGILEGARDAAADLLSAAPETIAICTSFTDALCQVAWWLRPGKGQNVVSTDVDFPSVTYPWHRISEETGCEVRLVGVLEDPEGFDVDKIAAASPGVEFKGAPEGYVRIHENHHLWSKTRIGKAKLDGQYELVYETADLVEPDPFPKGYQ